jgi:hypothetical protein
MFGFDKNMAWLCCCPGKMACFEPIRCGENDGIDRERWKSLFATLRKYTMSLEETRAYRGCDVPNCFLSVSILSYLFTCMRKRSLVSMLMVGNVH